MRILFAIICLCAAPVHLAAQPANYILVNGDTVPSDDIVTPGSGPYQPIAFGGIRH